MRVGIRLSWRCCRRSRTCPVWSGYRLEPMSNRCATYPDGQLAAEQVQPLLLPTLPLGTDAAIAAGLPLLAHPATLLRRLGGRHRQRSRHGGRLVGAAALIAGFGLQIAGVLMQLRIGALRWFGGDFRDGGEGEGIASGALLVAALRAGSIAGGMAKEIARRGGDRYQFATNRYRSPCPAAKSLICWWAH